MILENGLIRTLDPSALAPPEVVDLGGRVVVPGFTDSPMSPDD